MRKPSVYRRSLLLSLAFCCLPATGIAKEWAIKMFHTVEHDFGVVARGAVAEFDFEFQNIYKEDIHVANVRSSCGCATPTISQPLLKTWEKGSIHTVFNTRSFLGAKNATITVTIDKPYFAEVQLHVKGFIRQDVVFHPGAVEFGEIDAGQTAIQSVAINYAGQLAWSIINVEAPPFLKTRWREVKREAGKVGYELQVALTQDAPVGYVTDQIVVVTNDRQMSRIPLAVQARVVPSVTVSPKSLALGVLRPGERVTKQILVTGKVPFEVTHVHCDGDCLTFEKPSGSKKRHFIPVTFSAGDTAGELAMTIHIQTNLGRGAVATCVATAKVRDPADDT